MVDTFSWGGGGKRGRIGPVTARRARRPLPVKRVVFGLLSVLVAGAFGTGAYVLYSLRGTGDVLAAMAPADSTSTSRPTWIRRSGRS
jgi:hypothetical protein